MTPGRFITLEGGEGCGKSTQAALLAKACEAAGLSVLQTREPGGTPGAEAVRRLVLEGAVEAWDPVSELLLFFAARRDLTEKKIKPALAAGQWVVCDRFADSSLVYQVEGQGGSRSMYRQCYHMTLGNFAPDLTLVLDLPAAQGLARTRRRAGDTDSTDRFEQRDTAFHETIRQGFLRLVRDVPERCALIDATGTIEQVHEAIVAALDARLKLKLSPVSAYA